MASVEDKKKSSEKNVNPIYCQFCSNKILNAGVGDFVNTEFSLHNFNYKPGAKDYNIEMISDSVMVKDIFDFDYVAFSHTVDTIRFLACGKCEKGPIGWQDDTKKSYIALSRVRQGNPDSEKK